MRPSSLATALVAFSAGVTATLAARRLAARRAAAVPAAVTAPVAAPATAPVEAPAVETDAVVLAFPRPVAVPAGPARCGDSGGLTRAGAPCGARATATGRCHHHPLAA
jgi:hypothetical protein